MGNDRKIETLLDLLDEYGIVIPVIQRDYAFGRKEQKKKRESFLDALFEPLKESGSPKSFDFIYGRPDEVSGRFVPLDGQQRLTTLWLLYWYLFQRAGRYEEIAGRMEKFSYETRVSSKRFCRLLSSWRGGISGDGFINEIKDSPQFDDRWMLDPTVDAVLRMLEEIHSKVKPGKEKSENIDVNLACDQCLARAHRFDLLDMSDDNFRLTDSLYVKMNGRGKQLTDFENWKASFIDFLDRSHGDRFTPAFGGEEMSFKDYFPDRMEHKWTDMLWPYAFDKWHSLSEDEKRKAKYPIIDDMFMSLFGHITEMLYYSDNDTDKAEADIIGQWKTVYAKRENVEFLFNALDLLYRIKADKFWDKLLDSISLFDNDDAIDNRRNLNLFKRAIGGFSEDREDGDRPRAAKLGNDQKVLLYFILRYCIYKKQETCDENLRDFVRVVRNVAVRTKQLDYKTYRYSSNLRMYQLYKLNKDIDKLITSSGSVYSTLADEEFVKELGHEGFKHEGSKARLIVRTDVKDTINALENMEIFRGDLRNLPLDDKTVTDEKDDKTVTAKEVKETMDWFVDGASQAAITNERIRLLVAYGFKGLNHGSMRFYGTYDRWDTIFQFSGDEGYREELRDILLRIVTDRRESGSAEELIARQPQPQPYSQDAEERIRYYILRYPAIMDIETGRDGCTHLFYIYGNSLERGKLMQWGSFRSVRSYNVNPFYFLIKDKLGDQDGQIYFRDYDIPMLEYKGVKMDAEDFRWNVKEAEDAEDGVKAFISGPLKELMESEAYQKADLVEQGKMLLESIGSAPSLHENSPLHAMEEHHEEIKDKR